MLVVENVLCILCLLNFFFVLLLFFSFLFSSLLFLAYCSFYYFFYYFFLSGIFQCSSALLARAICRYSTSLSRLSRLFPAWSYSNFTLTLTLTFTLTSPPLCVSSVLALSQSVFSSVLRPRPKFEKKSCPKAAHADSTFLGCWISYYVAVEMGKISMFLDCSHNMLK